MTQASTLDSPPESPLAVPAYASMFQCLGGLRNYDELFFELKYQF